MTSRAITTLGVPINDSFRRLVAMSDGPAAHRDDAGVEIPGLTDDGTALLARIQKVGICLIDILPAPLDDDDDRC